MKICWDNLEKITFTINGMFKVINQHNTLFEKECSICNESFLGQAKAFICSNDCKKIYLSDYWKDKFKNPENHPQWKGGLYQYWHKQAYKLLGKNKCKYCDITNRLHKILFGERLSMHNTLDPKDYTIIEPHAWETVCRKCHLKIDDTITNNRIKAKRS